MYTHQKVPGCNQATLVLIEARDKKKYCVIFSHNLWNILLYRLPNFSVEESYEI